MCAHLLWQWWISKLIWFLSAGQYYPLGWQMFRTSSSLLPSGISLSHHQGWEILLADGRTSLTAGHPKPRARGGRGCPEQSFWPQPLPNSPSTIRSSYSLACLFWKLHCKGLDINPSVHTPQLRPAQPQVSCFSCTQWAALDRLLTCSDTLY